ncbi:hypothetical protein, partial [Paraburkholderia xenovorans]|uniref:hypothetical protein n=1 Tax=Paraburkholderia xenovorans TaxID=36873 RepID=UPI0038B8BD23
MGVANRITSRLADAALKEQMTIAVNSRDDGWQRIGILVSERNGRFALGMNAARSVGRSRTGAHKPPYRTKRNRPAARDLKYRFGARSAAGS